MDAALSTWLALTALLALPAGAAHQDQEPPGLAFVSAQRCAQCHSEAPGATAMRDSSGASVAPVELWRASMMASSARDPLWRAVLSAEVAALPQLRAAIETKCLRCHAPVLAATPEGTLEAPSSLAELAADATLSGIAREGVGCLVCHQILPDGLGTQASFTAGARLTLERLAFGPHAAPFTRPMRMRSGFTPSETSHVMSASLCGSCHTVITSARDDAGQELGLHFGEQTPYLEWRSSAFRDEGEAPGALALACQDCHLPTVDGRGNAIRTRIARNPGGRDFPPIRERAPYGRHLLTGGNTLVPLLLAGSAASSDAGVPREAYEAKAAAARAQLGAAARVAIRDLQRDAAGLRFEVEVSNLAGHKLPTGYPARRAWLHVRVRDAAGELVFESGAHDERGRLLGVDGRPAPEELAGGPLWTHRARIQAPGEVQVYEAVPADADGVPTFRLLAAAGWAKDDRILPIGFDPEPADAPHVRPHGVEGDDDFEPGFDSVHYELALPHASSPLAIEVELAYQPLGARWLDELARIQTPEVARLLELLERVPPPTEVIARARARCDA